jgi:uncharacterized protein YyaL (SSP411 family)
MDAAEPSTNGTSAQNLFRLHSMLEDASYADYAKKTCRAFETELLQHPFLFSSMAPAIVASALGVRNVVVVGDNSSTDKVTARARGSIETVVRIGGKDVRYAWLQQRNPLLANVDPTGRSRVIVCERGVCKEEMDMGEVRKALDEVSLT